MALRCPLCGSDAVIVHAARPSRAATRASRRRRARRSVLPSAPRCAVTCVACGSVCPGEFLSPA